VERLGVERSERAALAADITIHVRDCSRREPGAAVASTMTDIAAMTSAERAGARIEVWNKCDLGEAPHGSGDAARTGVATVAIRPGGVDALVDALRRALPAVIGDAGHGGPADARAEIPATSLRQEALLREATAALERAERVLRVAPASRAVAFEGVAAVAGTSAGAATAALGASVIHAAAPALDLVAVDLTEARRALGEIVGRGVDDAVVAAIFARFCIGK
jgi:tRNA U34 5-carboxymethylaminomethyl modifying GTPase MnmE/TrmE